MLLFFGGFCLTIRKKQRHQAEVREVQRKIASGELAQLGTVDGARRVLQAMEQGPSGFGMQMGTAGGGASLGAGVYDAYSGGAVGGAGSSGFGGGIQSSRGGMFGGDGMTSNPAFGLR